MTDLQRTVARIKLQEHLQYADLDYRGACDTSSPDKAEKKGIFRAAKKALELFDKAFPA